MATETPAGRGHRDRPSELLTLDLVVPPRWLRERRRAERLAARPEASVFSDLTELRPRADEFARLIGEAETTLAFPTVAEIHHGAASVPLLTGNARHFAGLPGLQLAG